MSRSSDAVGSGEVSFMPPGEPSFIAPAGDERSMFSRFFPTALSSSGVGAGPHSIGNLMRISIFFRKKSVHCFPFQSGQGISFSFFNSKDNKKMPGSFERGEVLYG